MYPKIKPILDFVTALLLLAIFWPILLLVAIAIRLDSRGPALYKQTRVGQGAHGFTIFKFRSMKIDTPVLSTAEMQQQTFNPFTRLGPFLRKSNLDELPQLFNILLGNMSFVGPRPALPSQTDVNNLRETNGVHALKPGITGLAQALGRDDLDTETKVKYDTEYLHRLSFVMDARILVLTLGAIFTARGNK
ncbi:MAG TPA: sugar transferase [Abditibacteriaceae bacterium]|jgi:lipopolysaccharide/colanic/teichoic acid biosynthesis glycosyltransferase